MTKFYLKNKKFILFGLIIIATSFVFVATTPSAFASGNWKKQEINLLSPFLNSLIEKVLASVPGDFFPDNCSGGTAGATVGCEGSSARVNITWSAAPDLYGKTVDCASGPQGAWHSDSATLKEYQINVGGVVYTTTNTQFSASDLLNNTPYDWSVEAIYEDLESASGYYSCTSANLGLSEQPAGSFTTPNCGGTPPPPPPPLPPPPINPPASPVNFNGQCPAPGQIATLSWNPVSDATYYLLRLDDKSDGFAPFSGITNFGQAGDIPFVGDWNGDGIAREIGTLRGNEWFFDLDGDGIWNGCPPPIGTGGPDGCSNGFGNASAPLNDQPIIGAWNGGAVNKIGVFRPGSAQFFLDTNGNRNFEASDAAINFSITPLDPNDKGVAGDWNGDGITEIGIFRNGQWFLDTNNDGTADLTGSFGKAGDIPITGDWNKDGVTEIGVFRPSTAEWFLDNGNRTWNGCGTTAQRDICYSGGSFGFGTDKPVIGRWGGTGTNDRIGVFRSGAWFMDMNGSGRWDEFWSDDASPNSSTTISGHEYVGWIHACSAGGCSNPANTSFTCIPPPAILSVSINGGGTGTVISTNPVGHINCPVDCSRNYNPSTATAVTLAATAKAGSAFDGWFGCDSTSGVLPNQTCNVVMTANKNVVATFSIYPPPPNCAFYADPPSIILPNHSNLKWACQNTNSCSIDNGIGSVNQVSGSKQVTPRNTTTYNLSCSGTGGSNSWPATLSVGFIPWIREIIPRL